MPGCQKRLCSLYVRGSPGGRGQIHLPSPSEPHADCWLHIEARGLALPSHSCPVARPDLFLQSPQVTDEMEGNGSPLCFSSTNKTPSWRD